MFRLVDHTADLAIEASGKTREEALQEAALGLSSVLCGRNDPRGKSQPDQEIHFALETPDVPSMLVAFLSELLWLHESEDLLWLGGGVTVTETPKGMLLVEAKGNGVHHDPTLHGRGIEVKAVTYHDLRFEQDKKGIWQLWVLLDV